ncbi:MAG: pyruvate kinase [Planctomycetes bacterium]|nr:pyruvate kinase [Planctomycetota bacterium]
MSIQTSVRLLKHRRTKIVATLGPASHDPGTIEDLARAGADVFRLNFSHGSHEDHAAACRLVRAAAEKVGRPLAVLADLSGPKIRCGLFREGKIELATGARITVTTRDVSGESDLVPSQYAGLASDVGPGDRVLLDDGLIELAVEGVKGTEIACRVVRGGTLRDRKGMNLPGIEVSAPSLTEKDREDARFALSFGADFLALSFVRRPADVEDLRALVRASGHGAAIVAKIEKPEALANIDGVLEAADAVMVARGDLGVELPLEEVPVAQDEIVIRAREKEKPVIVATQMLESMVEHGRPTRAEVSDVSHAVTSGADAVMLSAETASGAHPVLAVETMDRIVRQAESHLWRQGAFGSIAAGSGEIPPPIPLNLAVARSTALLSRDLLVRAIVVLSSTGRSTRSVSSARPAAPIVAASPDAATCRRNTLLWGAVPVKIEPGDLADGPGLARKLARDLCLAAPGESVLLVRGFHEDPARNAPSVTVLAS